MKLKTLISRLLKKSAQSTAMNLKDRYLKTRNGVKSALMNLSECTRQVYHSDLTTKMSN